MGNPTEPIQPTRWLGVGKRSNPLTWLWILERSGLLLVKQVVVVVWWRDYLVLELQLVDCLWTITSLRVIDHILIGLQEIRLDFILDIWLVSDILYPRSIVSIHRMDWSVLLSKMFLLVHHLLSAKVTGLHTVLVKTDFSRARALILRRGMYFGSTCPQISLERTPNFWNCMWWTLKTQVIILTRWAD